MSTVRGMAKRGGVARWAGHDDKKLNYSSSSLDSDESDNVGTNRTKGPPPLNVRGSPNNPPPGIVRSSVNTPPPGDIRTALNTPPSTVKHLGSNDGTSVNGSLNTSSSTRIRGQMTRDKKCHQNGFITMMNKENEQIGHTTTTNHTKKVSVMQEPALVKDHIPVETSKDEFQETRDNQRDKEFQEEMDIQKDIELKEGRDSLKDKELEEGRCSLEKNQLEDGSSSQKYKQFQEERDYQKDEDFQNERECKKYKDFQEKRVSQKDKEFQEGIYSQKDSKFQEGNNSQKDKEFQERSNKQKYKDTPTDKDDKHGDNFFSNSVHSKENNIIRSILLNKTSKSFERKNSLEIKNNNINKKDSINEDKKHSMNEDKNYFTNANKHEEKEIKDNEIRSRIQKPEGYVGFGSLPSQVCRKAVRRGFEFTLMVVGESGLGKSTLVNSMFLTDIYSSKFPGTISNVPKTLNVETHKVILEEGGVKLSLTVVDTPGFGDAVDNTGCWEPITNFVDQQYEKFLEAETRVNRVELSDTRVHVCLYFIAPIGHGLKPLDIEFMSKLHHKVNIIPVIGKADACTAEELIDFKQKILAQIADTNIQIYSYPEGEKDGDDWMRKRMPFAVVGSNTVLEGKDGKRLRGRKYPWGTVIIENTNHCDFLPLRDLLVAHHMQDLKDVTNYVHYENFRCRRLTEMFSKEGITVIPNKNPLAALEDDVKEHTQKVEKTMEDMEEVFERKVEEKGERLKESEINMDLRLQETRDKLEEQKNELEKQREEFLKEKKVWENNNLVSMMELRRKQSLESLLDGKKKKYGLGMMTFKIRRTKNDHF